MNHNCLANGRQCQLPQEGDRRAIHKAAGYVDLTPLPSALTSVASAHDMNRVANCPVLPNSEKGTTPLRLTTIGRPPRWCHSGVSSTRLQGRTNRGAIAGFSYEGRPNMSLRHRCVAINKESTYLPVASASVLVVTPFLIPALRGCPLKPPGRSLGWSPSLGCSRHIRAPVSLAVLEVM